MSFSSVIAPFLLSILDYVFLGAWFCFQLFFNKVYTSLCSLESKILDQSMFQSLRPAHKKTMSSIQMGFTLIVGKTSAVPEKSIELHFRLLIQASQLAGLFHGLDFAVKTLQQVQLNVLQLFSSSWSLPSHCGLSHSEIIKPQMTCQEIFNMSLGYYYLTDKTYAAQEM